METGCLSQGFFLGNMRRYGSGLGLVLALVLTGMMPPVWADELPYRIAVVNLSRVLENAPQSSAESRRLEATFSSREATLEQERLALQQAKEAYQQTANTLSKGDRLQRGREMRILEREYNRNLEDLREEIRAAKDSALEKVQDQVERAVDAVRAQEKIDIVFRESDYIVASARVNMTDKVLAYLQQQFISEQQQAPDTPKTGE